MRIPKFNINQIVDKIVQDNFTLLLNFMRAETPLQDFHPVLVKLTTTGKQKIPHGLGYFPQDILLTQISGPGTIVWNYSEFTATSLSVTVSGTVSPATPLTIRCLAGTLNQGAT